MKPSPFAMLCCVSLGLGCSSGGGDRTHGRAAVIRDVWPSTLRTSGPTRVRVIGSGFGPDTQLRIGDVPITSFQIVDDTHLEVDAPAGVTGSPKLVVSEAEADTQTQVWYGGWHRIDSAMSATSVNEVREDGSSPGALLAATTGGFYRSSDGGRTWQIGDPAMTSIVDSVSAGADGAVYLITEGDDTQLLRRKADEVLWTSLSLPGRPERVYADPKTPDLVFLHTDDGLSRSTDSGQSWSQVTGAPAYAWGHSTVAFAASQPGTFFVAGVNADGAGELWRSDDAGATASLVYSGSARFEEVAVDPTDATHLFVREGNLLHRSTDGGQTWDTVDGPVSGGVRGIAVDGASGRFFEVINDYAGATVRSLEPGSSTFVDEGSQPSAFADGMVAVGGRVVASNARSGVIVGDAAGGGFTASSDGFASPSVTTVAFDPGQTSRRFAGTNCGLYRSLDGGKSWSGPQPTIGCALMKELTFDPARPGVIYASTDLHTFRSLDGGDTWSQLAPVGGAQVIGHVAFDPSNQDLLLAGGDALYRSTDGGASWAVDPALGGAIFGLHFVNDYILAERGDGVWRSPDGGATWTQVFSGHVASLVVVEGTSYASSGDFPITLSKSQDGITWTRIDAPGAFFFTVDPRGGHPYVYGIDPKVNGTLFRAPFPAFQPWQQIGHGLESLLPGLPAFSPDDEHTMMVPTRDGVLQTITGGEPISD